MHEVIELAVRGVLIGIEATAFMELIALLRNRMFRTALQTTASSADGSPIWREANSNTIQSAARRLCAQSI